MLDPCYFNLPTAIQTKICEGFFVFKGEVHPDTKLVFDSSRINEGIGIVKVLVKSD